MSKAAIVIYYENTKEFPYPALIAFDSGKELPSKYMKNYTDLIREQYINEHKLAMMLGDNEDNISIFNNAVMINPMVNNVTHIIRYFFEVQTEIDDFYGCIDVVIYNGDGFDYCAFNELKYTNGLEPKEYLKCKIDTYHLMEYSKDPDTTADNIVENKVSEVIKDDSVPYSFVLALAVVCDKYSDAVNLDNTLKALKYNGTSVYDLLRR